MCEKRNRATGWKHAKNSGHTNESILAEKLKTDRKYSKFFLKAIKKENLSIKKVMVGGLSEKDVDSIFPNQKTKSKTDIKVFLSNGKQYNISVKKSLGGQVYLITDDRFIRGYESQYKEAIPYNVKRAIRLFWGSAIDTKKIIDEVGTNKTYEFRKNRLVADSLKKYKKELYEELLAWFSKNICNLIDFCFSKGLAKNEEDWADLVWYKNELKENNVNELFVIEEIKKRLSKGGEKNTFYGVSKGGTTIQLPFGFVQWHSPTKKIPGSMQFHHKYQKIKDLNNK